MTAAPAAPTILSAQDIQVNFGGVQAVAGVSFEVPSGQIFGVIGPNGSGKSTLLNALTGVVKAGGALRVADRPVRLGHPESARATGLARVYQAPQLIGDLSLLENVLLGCRDRSAVSLTAAWLGRPVMWRREQERVGDALTQLALVGLHDRATLPADRLTYGDQRLLELARALAAHPLVLMLDEPSAGLNDQETDTLAGLLRAVRDGGVTVLLVDHKIDFIDRICDQIMVLELGRRVASGPPAEIWNNPRVIEAYLGVAADARPS
jgi:ABC-type branched-subunit amino acid transport system ATPase component